MQAVMDSLAGLHLIGPLLVVGIEAGDRLQEYGVSSRPDYQGRGAKAGAYDSFVVSELLPFLRRRTSLEFRSLTIAGCSLGGLSAFDIAWNHPEIFQRVGVFSGSFWWRDKDLADPNYSDEKDRILYAKIHDSPRHARMACWFYVGQKEETADRNHNGIIDAVEDTRDLVRLLQEKNICRPPGLQEEENPSGTHDYAHWSEYLPHFLLWAFGKRSRPDHPFREMLLAPLECDSLITASPR
jgi:enterochelin esterase-like enzyme